ncbi:flagellar FlbD family protein [uncultured Jatrophihabitans sp.]|uniref:flagellar FlbD family protein n=1 Tax=uncultured Jatrophihabitans sp. TaxID=1610747 RepID=UPI0035CB71B1
MLQLTRLSGPVFALNPDLIERAESTPDTVVTLVNGSKYVIHESLDELITLIHEYRVQLVSAAQAGGGFAPTSALGGYQSAKPARESTAPATVVALHPGDA